MFVIGLTGSIGMGKSTLARQCQLLGAKTISADAIVHKLMQPSGRAFSSIKTAFPQAINGNGEIDRRLLGEIVFADSQKMLILEKILHGLVVEEEENYCRAQKKLGAKWLVLDIPLLFKTGAEYRFDLTIVASAPFFIQKQRVLKRSNMTEKKFQSILARQLPDRKKRKLADCVIHSGLGKGLTMRQIKILKELLFTHNKNTQEQIRKK